MASAAARPDAMRRHNLSLLLGHVHRDGPLTRAELTQRLGLSRSTIGALVADLAELGLIEESVPSGGDRVGRPSHLVGPHSQGPFVVAVDIDLSRVTTAAVGIGGQILARRVHAAGRRPATPVQVAQLITRSIPALAAEACRDSVPVGVGVSVPGTVDRGRRVVGLAPNLGWRNVALGDLLDTVGAPVVIGNDADLAVLAEYQRGAARGYEDLVYLVGRIGVGAGIIVNGRPLRGHEGHAGEIGHNVVDPTGPACHCGKRGCLETYIGDGALLTLAGREGPANETSVRTLFADARAGDSAALRAVSAVAASLGRALGSLVNTLNPQQVILGGSFADVLEIAAPDVGRALEQYALDVPEQSVQLAVPSLGADSALLGAAELAFAALLDDPVGDQVLLPR